MGENTKEIVLKERNQVTNVDFSDITIKKLIYVIRGEQVMLDSDLAMLYQVETGALNRAVKRNIKRFPEEFCFQLTSAEYENLKCQIGISSLNEKGYGGRRYMPYVFTEQGIAMLSAVLKSEIAIKVSIRIMKTFVEMRQYLARENFLLEKVNKLEVLQIEGDIKRQKFEVQTERKFEAIFNYIAEHEEVSQKIFFEGQIYDAFSLLIQLVNKAEKKIVLIDNYVDIGTLNILAKKKPNVKVSIYTLKRTKLSEEDVNNFNQQYPILEVFYTKQFHDRFLILDDKYAYHIGASIKDAGKKCFGINRIEDKGIIKDVMERLRLGT